MLQLLQYFSLFMAHYNIFAPVKHWLSGGDVLTGKTVQMPLARMASRHCSISQRGVLVAPQMPTVLMPSNHSD